jgi:hypothetical protein
MTEHCIVGVFRTLEDAKAAIRGLEQLHISPEKISLVAHSVQRELPNKQPLKPGDDTERTAAKGAGLGGLVGLLLGAPLLMIPGVGPVLLAGPLATGITGAIVGGFLGAMRGWGVHHDHVIDYEQKVKKGFTLVVVNGTPDMLAEAKKMMHSAEAQEVHLHEPDSADAPHIDDRPINAPLPR